MQEVFRREVQSVATLMRERFGAEGHTVRLVNSSQSLLELPIATKTSLRAALEKTAKAMDKEEDVLVLFLTSHGSETHRFSISLVPLQLEELDPVGLRALLDESGIRNRVVIVSASTGRVREAARGSQHPRDHRRGGGSPGKPARRRGRISAEFISTTGCGRGRSRRRSRSEAAHRTRRRRCAVSTAALARHGDRGRLDRLEAQLERQSGAISRWWRPVPKLDQNFGVSRGGESRRAVRRSSRRPAWPSPRALAGLVSCVVDFFDVGRRAGGQQSVEGGA